MFSESSGENNPAHSSRAIRSLQAVAICHPGGRGQMHVKVSLTVE